MADLPTGTVTFLFTDIEGSTRLLQDLGERYGDLLGAYRSLLRTAFSENGGREIDTQGDAFFVAFRSAREAVLAALEAQRAIGAHLWPEGAAVRVRMGLHTGEPIAATGGYIGLDVHRAARICAAGHGGQILLSQSTRSLVEHDLLRGGSLRDLGEHRLKDLQRPEKLFQLLHPELPAAFRPLASLDVLPHNLPVQLTSFIGRQREIGEVRQLLSTTRLLTLAGAGGCGKTRLALQVAAEVLERFAGGVWLVELAPLADPTLVPQTVASAVGAREQAGRPLLETLKDALQRREVLLVLDNCEHVVEACAGLGEALLRGCPTLRVLATSRQALGIAGEGLYRVPSLSLPDPRRLPPLERLAEYEAIKLFIERATSVLPTFALTAQNALAMVQMCRQLDGIPLAIELAAARVKVLTVEQIAGRLDDRFRLLTGGSRGVLPRHQTLRATMDWSYGLLSERERIVLRRLAVFAGGWTLEAAEEVCAGGALASQEILDLLTHLVDRSLVVVEEHHGAARYRLLETVRQYARDRLVEVGEADSLRPRHRDFFLALAERAEPGLRGPGQAFWWNRLDIEYDNLRAAMEWSKTEDDDPEPALRLGWALWHYWDVRARLSEARAFLGEMLARSTTAVSPARARALNAAGVIAYRQGDIEHVAAYCGEALALSRQLGDTWSSALALHYIAHVAQARGEHSDAERLMTESISAYRDLTDTWGTAWSTNCLGDVARSQQDYARAATLLQESLTLFRSLADKPGMAFSLHNLAYATLRLGNRRLAEHHFRESLALGREIGFKEIMIISLAGLGAAAGDAEPRRVARLLGAAEGLLAAAGFQLEPADRADFDRNVTTVRARLEEESFAAAWAEGRAMTLEQAIDDLLPREDIPKAAPPVDLLTPREQEVAAQIAQGLTNQDIAKALGISEGSAETHIQHILSKLGFDSLGQIATWAAEQGLYKPHQT